MFPILQVAGIAGMIYAFVNNASIPQLRLKVYINAALFISIISLFAFFWLKYMVKKPLIEAELWRIINTAYNKQTLLQLGMDIVIFSCSSLSALVRGEHLLFGFFFS